MQPLCVPATAILQYDTVGYTSQFAVCVCVC